CNKPSIIVRFKDRACVDKSSEKRKKTVYFMIFEIL
ncbi:MAG: hypothetical protein ACI9KI_000660, partial [Patiriisocius sp.]